jgi:PAS domain S-box-containing protein
MHPDDIDAVEEAARAYLAGETAEYEREIRFRHINGSYRTLLGRGAAVRDAAGKPIRFAGIIIDITRLKLAEDALRASEARFRALVQNSSDIISLFDSEGTVVYQSPSVERLLGYRPEDRIGHNVFRDPIVHPDDLEAKQAFFVTALSNPTAPVTAGFRLRHANGSWREIEGIGQNFLHDPNIAGIVANYRDVTDRKKAEEALRQQAKLLRLSYDAIIVWRLNDGIETWSRGAQELYGYTEVEAAGRVTHELLQTVHPVPWAKIEAKLAEGGSWEGELRHRTKAGDDHGGGAKKIREGDATWPPPPRKNSATIWTRFAPISRR